MAGPTLSHFQSQVRVIKERTAQLPATIPLATKDSRIATIFARLPIPDAPEEIWEVYTRRLDILYGESNRDGKTGRLPNIERGKHGLDMIVGFLELVVASTDWHKHFQWDAAMPKVLRLANELKDVIALATKSNGKRARHSTANAKGSDSEDDANYQPPKKKIDSDSDSNAPSAIFNSDGEEIVQETEVSKDLEAKREKKRREDQAEPGQEKMSKKKKKKQGKKKVRSKSPGTSQKPIDLLDSGEESDGQTAARKAAADAAKPRGARRGPPNQSMQHFSKPVATVDKTKQPRWEFKCKFCSAVRTFPRTVTTDNPSFDKEKTLPGGFNNLASHLSKCLPFKNRHSVQDSTDDEDEVDATDFNYKQSVQIMERFLKDGKLNPELVATREGFLRVFAAWILDQDLPWTTGEAPSLIFLFKYLKIKFLLPSDTAVRNQLAKMFAEMHQDVVEEFANVKSKIAFACDTWTTKQMVYTFACTIASFINDEWELIERVIDFRPLDSKEHEGLYAGMSFINSARNMSILHKFSALSTDNASVNDVLFKTVSRALLTLYNISPQGDSPDKDGRHIHCLAHVLNLVVQDMLSALDEAEKCVNEGDENDHYMQNKGAPIHYDPSQDSDLQDLEANREDDLNGTKDTNLSELEDLFKDLEMKTSEEVVKGKSALQRLRFIATKITSSPQRCQTFWRVSLERYGPEERVDEGNPNSPRLCTLMVIRDVRTRWNSTYAMLKRAIVLKKAINGWVNATEEYESLHITQKEWGDLEFLVKILEPFAEATEIVSMAKRPSIPYVLPIYHTTEESLTALREDPSTSPIFREAIVAGLRKLRKYKATAVANHTYMLATALHPSMRSLWFKRTVARPASADDAKHRLLQAEEVNRVQVLVRAIAETYLEDDSATSTSPPHPQNPTRSLAPSSSLKSMCDVEVDPDVIPSVKIQTPLEKLDAELNRYFIFEHGKAEDLYDPLAWWKAHAEHFPTLAKVARDILPISAGSVSCERTFSSSRQICTDLRSSLKGGTVRKALLTKVWLRGVNYVDLVRRREPVVPHGSTLLL